MSETQKTVDVGDVRPSRNMLEISTGPNTPIVFQRAPNALNLRSNFLARFNAHFLAKGEKVFDIMLEQNPSL
jgi:hypothetical protein